MSKRSPATDSLLPPAPPGDPLQEIYQPQQHRDLHQGPNGRRKRLIAVGPISGHGNRNRQLEIVARRREALRRRQLIPKAKLVRDPQRSAEYEHKVHQQRRGDAHHGDDLVHDLPALASEEHEDGV